LPLLQGLGQLSRDTEVSELDLSLLGEQEIASLDVTVDVLSLMKVSSPLINGKMRNCLEKKEKKKKRS